MKYSTNQYLPEIIQVLLKAAMAHALRDALAPVVYFDSLGAAV